MRTPGPENLPGGWSLARLGEILPLTYGKGLVEERRDSKGPIPVFGSSGRVGFHSNALVEKPSLIIGRKGNVGSVHHSEGPCWVIDTAYYTVGQPPLSLPFFRYLLDFLQLGRLDRSTAVPGLSRNDYDKIEVPIAPEREQARIVGEIEKQFTRLDAAVAALKRVQANLKRYRASVLKAACEGRLVPVEAELARREGRSYEPASILLERLLNGHSSRRVSREERLPEGWASADLGQLSSDAGYGTSEKCDHEWAGPPVLRIPNIVGGGISLNDLKFARPTTQLAQSESLAPGDMLIIRTNGSRDLIGRSAVVSQHFARPHYFASYLIRFRLQGSADLWNWLSSIWDAPGHRSRIEALAATTAGQYNLNIAKLNLLPVPIPPLPELRRIVLEVQRRMSVIEEIDAQLKINLQRAERLRQGILKEAFKGKLVPQDPKDEPASVLLERIHSDRNTNSKSATTRRRRKGEAHVS